MRKVEDIDVIQLIERIGESATLGKFLLKPSTIGNAVCATGFQAMSCLTNNLVLDAIFLLAGCYSVARTINNWKMYKDLDYNLCLELEKTDVYRRLCENYFTFVHETAKFAKQFGLKNSKEVLLLFELMMNNGYLSETKTHEHHSYLYTYPEMSGTLGSQVMTGSCVCRHMSSLFADLLHQMNISGCNIVVKINYEDEVEQFLKLGRKKTFNHLVLGVVEDDKKYVYDPTRAVFAGRCENKFKGYSLDEVSVSNIEDKKRYLFPDSSSLGFNKLHIDELKAYNKASMDFIDEDEIVRLRTIINGIYKGNIDMFEKFYFQYLQLMQDIAMDVHQLMPKVDEELKEWVLKY